MKRSIVYQIYPSSFNDTSGSGYGDIKGIIEKLDYIKSLNVNYIWISPIFKSPLKDNGYDISDYTKINSTFGTMKDLQDLIFAAKKRDIGIMLDMVFNHTSTSHDWFKQWVSGNEQYKNFYISKESYGKPPTNWVSKFGGSAWVEYKLGKWYLSLFDETQADLNWDNVHVRNKLKEILIFYLKMGVRGFRFDVINLISKSTFKDDFDGDGRRMYVDGPNVHKYVHEITSVFKNMNLETVGELSSTDIENAAQFANNNKTELTSVFTFHHLKVDYEGLNKFTKKTPNIKELNNVMKKWSEGMSKRKATMANFFTNHDQPRAVSRFVDKKFRAVGAKMLYALCASLPGIPYIYQGEEIGMTNPNFMWKSQHRDVETLNYLNSIHSNKTTVGTRLKSRDNSRTPMQWDNKKNASFTSGKPWIPINSNYKKINVKISENNKNSILNFYREMNKFISKDKILNFGNIIFEKYQPDLISFKRTYKTVTYKFVFSFSNKSKKYLFKKKSVIKSNYYDIKENTLMPYQFFIERM